jgi:hypothetical protein
MPLSSGAWLIDMVSAVFVGYPILREVMAFVAITSRYLMNQTCVIERNPSLFAVGLRHFLFIMSDVI